MLAMQADVRLAAEGDYRIGLNEVAIGLGLPAVVLETLRLQVSPQSLAPVAVEGRLFLPEEARSFGLVEAVLPAPVLLEQARGRAAELAALPRPAFREVKRALREPVAAAVRRVEREDARRWVETAFSPAARERLAGVIARLGRPR